MGLDSSGSRCRPSWLRLSKESLTFDELLGRTEIRNNQLMLHVIDQDVLWLDVSVCDGEHGEVVKPSEDLIGIDLDKDRIDFSLLDDLVEVV
jgi:hypothetical protein